METQPLIPHGVIVAMACVLLAGLWIDIRVLATLRRRVSEVEPVDPPLPVLPAVLLVALVSAAQLAIGLLAWVFGDPAASPSSPSAVRALVAQTLLLPVCVLVGTGWLLNAQRRPWSDILGPRSRGTVRAFAAGLAGYAAMLPPIALATLAGTALLRALGIPITPQPAVELLRDPSLPFAARAYTMLVAILIAPVAEELLFRGVLLAGLRSRYGAASAALMVSAVFAGMHGHLPSFGPLFAMSLALCAARLLTGSLKVPMVMHGAFNAVTVIAVIRGWIPVSP